MIKYLHLEVWEIQPKCCPACFDYRSINALVLLREKWFKSSARALMLMRPMHEPKVSALDEYQHQRKCTGFESFLEHQDLRMYWPNSYTSVNTFILRLIYQLNDLKQKYLTVNNTLFTHENVSEPIIAPGRGMFMPMNQSEQAFDKRQINHVPGPSVIYCGKTLLALWDDDMWIKSYISTRIFYILLLFKMLLSKITSCARNSTWVSWCWRALKLILTWNPVCQ